MVTIVGGESVEENIHDMCVRINMTLLAKVLIGKIELGLPINLIKFRRKSHKIHGTVLISKKIKYNKLCE